MSNEPKWTEGPWVIDTATRPMEVCTIHHLPDDERTCGQGWAYIRGELGHWDVDGDEAMANAHLIAAAPELYAELASAGAQLEMAAEAIEAGRMDEALLHCRSMTRPRRAALAKARGETS